MKRIFEVPEIHIKRFMDESILTASVISEGKKAEGVPSGTSGEISFKEFKDASFTF